VSAGSPAKARRVKAALAATASHALRVNLGLILKAYHRSRDAGSIAPRPGGPAGGDPGRPEAEAGYHGDMGVEAELKKLVADFLQLRKSAVSFTADLASTERPDAMIARANAFMSRLEDTAKRADEFTVALDNLRAKIRTLDLSAEPNAVAACAQTARDLEASETLELLEDDVLSVIGRQMAPRVERYNKSIGACLAALTETTNALHVAGGVLSIRAIPMPKREG
jgi:hypothetical protein